MQTLPYSPRNLVETLLQKDRRVLLFGPPGIGKTTLTAQLGCELDAAGRSGWCISADPGCPGFGVPGAVTLGDWYRDHWRVIATEALCTLDAGRYRLPLISAVRRLARQSPDGIGIVDGPGVVRGNAGKELLEGLVEALEIDLVLALSDADRPLLLRDELRLSGCDVYRVSASKDAKRPGKQARARLRTEIWDAYLSSAVIQTVECNKLRILGTPPPLEESGAWIGRQVALFRGGELQVMGEVKSLANGYLQLSVPGELLPIDTLLVRDATRTPEGRLETAVPFLVEPLDYIPAAEVVPVKGESGGPRVVGRVGHADFSLLNGVFGDPQLHLRLRHQGRSLLFDLGDGVRLPARIAHQVTDVFISHAHMDHISGFQWLLRSRMGRLPACRVYGPPGLARHIEGFFRCFLWDRIDEQGPVFELAELHGASMRRFRIQAGGRGCELLDEVPVEDGILCREPGFLVRTAMLDHRTPVMAYAFETEKEIKVRKDRLVQMGCEPGPWLTALKDRLLAGQRDAVIALPGGKEMSAKALGDELVLIRPGKKLVYATDLADTSENRRRLIALARHAHTFFCEAPFMEADLERASRTGHLTTVACAKIASAANVARLVPFHFSRRYADKPRQVYEEIKALCACVVEPKSSRVYEEAETGESKDVISLEAAGEDR